ncbi:hypothetical protein B0H14DRAFT_3146340 [Mycena olivaceomarginata]|nr:hypothetical protein B0H14DRAFT_3146340 [Mycena olivaceomarginata]
MFFLLHKITRGPKLGFASSMESVLRPVIPEVLEGDARGMFSLGAGWYLDTKGVTQDPRVDWKYGVGWDGKVLDPSIIGTPTSPNVVRSALVPRTPGGVFICTDINFGGTCGFAVQQLGQCIVLTSPWYQTISSFGPDPGATCFAYSQNSCSEAQWSFTFPGDATGGLGTNDPWNDRLRPRPDTSSLFLSGVSHKGKSSRPLIASPLAFRTRARLFHCQKLDLRRGLRRGFAHDLAPRMIQACGRPASVARPPSPIFTSHSHPHSPWRNASANTTSGETSGKQAIRVNTPLSFVDRVAEWL